MTKCIISIVRSAIVAALSAERPLLYYQIAFEFTLKHRYLNEKLFFYTHLHAYMPDPHLIVMHHLNVT